MPEITAPGSNPLQKYFRQPKLYLSLPSKGNFYSDAALEASETGEYPVYSMTARDEIAFKTPDALINGQSTVDVIKSCIPAIKDPWSMPSLDLDAALIAIRIATYGESMNVSTKIPIIEEEREFAADLRTLLSDLYSKEFEETIYVDELTIKIRPITYKEFTQSALKTFEEQRVFSLVNDDTVSEEEKLSQFNVSFKKLTELTVGMIVSSIVSIEVDGDVVKNPHQIKEFIENADKKFYETVLKHIEEQKKKFAIKPMLVHTSPEDIEKGAPATFEVPITFDQSNFFE
jgi:uncharacterized protein YqkB